MTDKNGVIYILTNPSFPDYVKIGYTNDIKERLKQLNRSECIPFAFRAYAIWKTDTPLQDKDIHNLIDSINPGLRSIDEFDGKPRVREFYALSPEDAYSILEGFAKIKGNINDIMRVDPTGQEIEDEVLAKAVQSEVAERRSPFSFKKCNIPIGSKIQFINDPSKVATVTDDREIEYLGERGSLSGIAQEILKTKKSLQGTMYWTYNGKKLTDIRTECEDKGTYC